MAKTIAQLMAAEAAALKFEELPADVVHQTKRSILDALGVSFGGYPSLPSKILQNMAKQAGGAAEATILGSGLKTSCLNASLANGAMFRCYDYASTAFITIEADKNTGHHSEAIPPLLAVAEWQKASGKELITSIVLAYELFNKIFDSVPEYDAVLDDQGFVHETMRAPCIMALAAGRMLGLNEDQMANALALAGCFNLELGMLNWCEEEVTMARNLRFPFAAYNGILGALMGKGGFKGPLNVFEGSHGLAEVVCGGKMDLEKLRQPRKDWTMRNIWIKRFAAGRAMHGMLDATLTLAKQHDIKAEDVVEIRAKTNQRFARILANPETRRTPATTYSADHSSYYCMAIAILDRVVGPDQFTEERLKDPRIQALSDKIVVEPEPKLDGHHAPGIVEITTKKGDKYRCEILRPKGHPLNPMTDADIEEKFQSMAGKFLDKKQMSQIVEAVYGLEKMKNVGDLMKLTVVPADLRVAV